VGAAVIGAVKGKIKNPLLGREEELTAGKRD
jgi:hypothetical protein